MKVRVSDGATDEEASAIAEALAQHVRDEVEVYVGDADTPTAVRGGPAEPAGSAPSASTSASASSVAAS
ncbi:acyl-CoA carboxylase subunit beta, partial [Halorussus sp. GCM10023401]